MKNELQKVLTDLLSSKGEKIHPLTAEVLLEKYENRKYYNLHYIDRIRKVREEAFAENRTVELAIFFQKLFVPEKDLKFHCDYVKKLLMSLKFSDFISEEVARSILGTRNFVDRGENHATNILIECNLVNLYGPYDWFLWQQANLAEDLGIPFKELKEKQIIPFKRLLCMDQIFRRSWILRNNYEKQIRENLEKYVS